jgi:adenosylcobinamide kinase/adenosylcobinamide-phosphate guanylyltransferase
MIALVTGGSASGKSAIAEDLVVRLKGENRCYLATMEAMDEESIQRITKGKRICDCGEIPKSVRNSA